MGVIFSMRLGIIFQGEGLKGICLQMTRKLIGEFEKIWVDGGSNLTPPLRETLTT